MVCPSSPPLLPSRLLLFFHRHLSPFILMVDRGDCTFVSKVRRAQQAGASAVLIADNVCTCGYFNTSPQECTMDPGLQCEQNEPIMADDGSGNDVSIPSFLLFKQDADAIKTVLKDQNGIVQVKLQWGIPAPDDRVEWELWSNPVEVVSKNFQKTFYPDVGALGASQQFTPHFYIFDGVQNGCHSNAANCGSLCVNQGRYCAVDPDSDLERGISGGDVVVESLRRLCIWQHHGQDGVGEKVRRTRAGARAHRDPNPLSLTLLTPCTVLEVCQLLPRQLRHRD